MFLIESCNNCALYGCVINFFSTFFKKNLWNVCRFRKKLYLCTRFREATRLPTDKARWSLTTFHTDKQYNVSLVSFWNRRLKSKVRNENTNRQIIWHTYISGQYKQFEQLIPFWYYRYNLQRRVWSWLRMNASYRLNTCKSRGLEGACSRETTGARVSNAYPTCPSYWDSLPKGRLIPNNMRSLHESLMKAPAMKDGDAFH